MNKRTPLIAAGVGLLVVIAMVAGLILPKASAVRAKQAEVAEAHQQEAQLRLTLEQLQASAERADRFRRALGRIEGQMPPTADLPGLIRLLNTTSAQAGVDFTSLTPGQPTLAPSGTFSVVPVQVTLVGRYFSLDNFMSMLEGLSRVSKVVDLQLAAGPTGLPQLQGTMSVQFFTTDLSAGPGSLPGPTTALPGAQSTPAVPGEEVSPTPSPTEGG